MQIFIKVLIFIVVTSIAAEYLVNRASSTILTILFVVVEVLLFYLLFYKQIKKLLK